MGDQNADEAEDFLKSDDLRVTSCLITDMRMLGMTGLELHNRLLQSASIIPAVLMTAFPNDKDRRRALHAGATCYLVEPFNDQDLLACVRSALASADSFFPPRLYEATVLQEGVGDHGQRRR